MCKESKPDFDLPTIQVAKKGTREVVPLYSHGIYDGGWGLTELTDDILILRCSGNTIAVNAEKVWQALKGLKKGKNK